MSGAQIDGSVDSMLDLVSITAQEFQDDLNDIGVLANETSQTGDTSNLTVRLSVASAELQKSGANRDLASGVIKQFVKATFKDPAEQLKQG